MIYDHRYKLWNKLSFIYSTLLSKLCLWMMFLIIHHYFKSEQWYNRLFKQSVNCNANGNTVSADESNHNKEVISSISVKFSQSDIELQLKAWNLTLALSDSDHWQWLTHWQWHRQDTGQIVNLLKKISDNKLQRKKVKQKCFAFEDILPVVCTPKGIPVILEACAVEYSFSGLKNTSVTMHRPFSFRNQRERMKNAKILPRFKITTQWNWNFLLWCLISRCFLESWYEVDIDM